MAIRKAYGDIADGQVHYRHVAGGGTPLILLHRTPVSSESFEPMLARIEGKRTAIAFDTPGFGQSFRPPGKPSATDYARWLLAAIDALGIGDFHLVAHHTGTHFATELAVMAPDRARSLLLSGVLHAGPLERAAMRAAIGQAQPIDLDGGHLSDMWSLMRGILAGRPAALVHAETMGAMTAFAGRDQAFDAILGQDFAALLRRVICPVHILQACDDPLMPMLARIRAVHPDVPIDLLGPAGITAPECQAETYAAAALAFAAVCESTPEPPKGSLMTDRRFQLVRTPAGFDLAQVRAPTPTPGSGEVLVRVHAVSINRRDVSIRDLSYPVADVDGFVPLSDAAGEIVALGAGVTGWSVGDRVCSTFFQDWEDGRISFPAIVSALGAGGTGVFADHVVLSANGIAAIPEGWSFEEGATLPCAGVTAWSALKVASDVQPGDWVLIIGTGGVALFALQIAVAAGARVVMLSSSDEKLALTRELGAAVTINYRKTPDWAEAVKAATGGGVQHVVELGGAGTVAQSLASAAIGGHIALIGAMDGFGGEISGIAMILSVLRVSAITVGSHADHLALSRFVADKAIRPVIDSIHEVAAAQAAYDRTAAGAFGKVVIRMAA